MATIPEALAIAIQHQQGGRLQAAEQIYRQILAVEPNQPDALHLLGLTASQLGQHEVAVEYIRSAIRLKGSSAVFHNNLGESLRALHRTAEAVACYRQALELKPGYAEAHNNLGVAFKEQGKLDEAVACCRRALELKPDYAEAHNNLGVAFKEQGKLDDAVACYRRTLELKPAFAQAHNNLGIALKIQGKVDEAIACYRRVLELNPNIAQTHNSLGIALKEQGKLDEAAACFRRALELKPDYAEACYNLGLTVEDLGDLDAAAACYRRTLELKPDYVRVHSSLGIVFKEQRRLDDAVACWRRALELKPDYVRAHSNLIYTQMFCPGYDARMIYEEHCRWNQAHAAPLMNCIEPHLNDRSPDRRLRIGYVSPNFGSHPVGRFLLPLLESHDRRRFEIFCYASVIIADAMTDRCREHADVWRDARESSDEQLAHAIRQDRIDILVDLTMHMRNNRLLVFARKPAPVQVTYLAYCGTTGLATMDYRLTDPHLDPPGQDDRFYCEQSVRLPETYWCYRPPIETPPVNPLPALTAGYVTFGSLNNFCKVSPPALATWSRLLRAVPGSRLILVARPGSHRERVRSFLAEQGISAGRVEFLEFQPLAPYFAVYQRIDVALDPFPYGGGTTTCDALWMGVPVVTLTGRTAVGRSGTSILSNLGLPELVARDDEQYVQIAGGLAADVPRLTNLRATLRQRIQSSPLMDIPRFTRDIEAAYRDMWRRWCEK